VLVPWVQIKLARIADARYFVGLETLHRYVLCSTKHIGVQVIDPYNGLAEVQSARHLARNAQFRPYGPMTLAITGALALLAAALQALWVKNPSHEMAVYLEIWIATATVSLAAITIDALTRARRAQSVPATEMILSALGQFVPAVVAGLTLTVVLLRCAPQTMWMLPGLWQVLFSLGVFSSCQYLPYQMSAAGVWYLTTGLTCLTFGSGERALSPEAMGVPFGIGQLLVALILRFGYEDADAAPLQ
jgi:hypothetical protein